MEKLSCKRCGHEWWPRRAEPPAVCPRCKRYDYSQPPHPRIRAQRGTV